MEKASNVKKHKVIKVPAERTMERATEIAASHENILPGSYVNSSHMSAKSVVKIATLSHATVPEENHRVPPSFGMGKHSPSLSTISFGIVFLNNLTTCFVFTFCVRNNIFMVFFNQKVN